MVMLMPSQSHSGGAIVNPYIGNVAQELQFLSGEYKKKKPTPFLGWVWQPSNKYHTTCSNELTSRQQKQRTAILRMANVLSTAVRDSDYCNASTLISVLQFDAGDRVLFDWPCLPEVSRQLFVTCRVASTENIALKKLTANEFVMFVAPLR